MRKAELITSLTALGTWFILVGWISLDLAARMVQQ